MKSKLFSLSFLLLLSASARASNFSSQPSMNDFGSLIHCEIAPHGSAGGRNSGAVIDQLVAHCEDGKQVRISGVGLGARYSLLAEVTLACSESEPSGTYSGLKAALAVVAGMQVGFFGSESGVCFLGSTELGLGAALDAVKLEIMDSKF